MSQGKWKKRHHGIVPPHVALSRHRMVVRRLQPGRTRLRQSRTGHRTP
jgi:hypothetical protein